MGDCICFYDRGGSSELASLRIGSGGLGLQLLFPLTLYLYGPRTQGSSESSS